MKKLLTLVVLTSLPALATSNVTLYGKIDESALIEHVTTKDTTIQEKSGFTAGSRWGIKGVEDLGSGYQIGFILENGFNIDTGEASDSGAAFNREAALYLNGPFGKFTLGRLGTLGFAQSTRIRTGWVFGVTHGGSAMSGMTGTTNLRQQFGRVDNAVAYESPEFSGLSLHLMYSNAVDHSANDGKGDDGDNKWSKNNHYYGAGLLYKARGIKSSIIYEREDNKGTKYKPSNLLTVGGEYSIGNFTPMAIYQYSWREEDYKQHTFGLSGKAKFGAGTLSLGARYIVARKVGNATTYGKFSKLFLEISSSCI